MKFLAKIIVAAFVTVAGATSAIADKLELLMFERSGCVYCLRWEREVGPAYPLTPQGQLAPLRKINIDRGHPALPLDAPVRYSPTFVLMKDGREVGRITGYSNDAMFWGVFSKMLERAKPSAGQGD
jgi:thioredoxin-related protein